MVLRVGLIGCGRVGIGRGTRRGPDLYYTHAGAYRRHPATRLVAAADPRTDRRRACARIWGVENLYRNHRDMLAAQKPDVVSVCVPESRHFEVVEDCLASGVRAVFCEKPLTTNYAQAAALARRCRQKGVVLAVNHQRRRETAHRGIQRFLQKGGLGKIQKVRCLYYGGLWSVGAHLIDLLRWFFGEVGGVDVLRVVDRKPLLVEARLCFPGGVTALLQACERKHFEIFEIDILGTGGRLQINDFGHRVETWKVGRSAEYGDRELIRTPAPFRPRMREAFLRAVDDVVGCLRSPGRFLPDGEDAARTVGVLQRIERTVRG